MIDVLFLTDKQVRQKLFQMTLEASRPVLVALVRHSDTMRAPREREPFVSLEASRGGYLDQVLVVDEGKVEGMWRDPVGDLAESLFPDDRSQAYLATGNYLLVYRGRPLGIIKKQPSQSDDLWLIEDALARAGVGAPAPDPTGQPARQRPARPSRPGKPGTEGEPSASHSGSSSARRPPPPAPPPKVEVDPFSLLGIPRGTPRPDARKTFHALIAQYHPDKVSHLAPEFRSLAEEKTRLLLEAWAKVEPQCP